MEKRMKLFVKDNLQYFHMFVELQYMCMSKFFCSQRTKNDFEILFRSKIDI